jgi:hypothetical protein
VRLAKDLIGYSPTHSSHTFIPHIHLTHSTRSVTFHTTLGTHLLLLLLLLLLFEPPYQEKFKSRFGPDKGVVDERTKVVVSHGMGNYSMLRTLVSLGPLNPHLVVLNLAGSGINAESAMEFARGAHKWVALETLNLARNRMGPEGAKPLAKALLSMNRLKSLNMMDIACMADGARALAKSLRRMHTIVSLQMAKNQVGAEGAKALATSVHDMERLEEFCINKFALPVKHLKGEGGEEMNFSSQEIQYEDVIIISFLLKGSRGSLHTINFANNGTHFAAYHTHTPYTIHHTPCIIHHTPHTSHLTPHTSHCSA